jgi:hypothetical protein
VLKFWEQRLLGGALFAKCGWRKKCGCIRFYLRLTQSDLSGEARKIDRRISGQDPDSCCAPIASLRLEFRGWSRRPEALLIPTEPSAPAVILRHDAAADKTLAYLAQLALVMQEGF